MVIISECAEMITNIIFKECLFCLKRTQEAKSIIGHTLRYNLL